jgi:hypothetical protein
MAIDPLSVPYMQRAFGGGQLDGRDLRQLLQGSPMQHGLLAGGAMGGGTPMGGGGLGLGSAPPAPMAQGPGVIQHGSSGSGPNSMLMGALSGLGGNQASFDPTSGNWTPGAGGFPAGIGSMLMSGGK